MGTRSFPEMYSHRCAHGLWEYISGKLLTLAPQPIYNLLFTRTQEVIHLTLMQLDSTFILNEL